MEISERDKNISVGNVRRLGCGEGGGEQSGDYVVSRYRNEYNITERAELTGIEYAILD